MILILALACRGDTASTACDVPAITATWPAADQDQISRSATITVQFDGSIPAESISASVTADGADVAGSVQVDDGRVTWTPQDLLPAEAEVAWAMDLCGAEVSGSFQTGAEGEQVEPTILDGDSWTLDMESATWVEPVGGELIFGEVFTGLLLLGVQEVNEDSIDLIGGAAQDVEGALMQDPCVATFDFPAADFLNNPYVTVGPTVLEVEVQGLPVEIQQVSFSGAFSADGESILDARLEGEVDARDIAPSVGASADDLCELLSSYLGVECVECSSDLEPLCLRIRVEDIPGERAPGLTVAPNPDPQECEESDDREE